MRIILILLLLTSLGYAQFSSKNDYTSKKVEKKTNNREIGAEFYGYSADVKWNINLWNDQNAYRYFSDNSFLNYGTKIYYLHSFSGFRLDLRANLNQTEYSTLKGIRNLGEESDSLLADSLVNYPDMDVNYQSFSLGFNKKIFAISLKGNFYQLAYDGKKENQYYLTSKLSYLFYEQRHQKFFLRLAASYFPDDFSEMYQFCRGFLKVDPHFSLGLSYRYDERDYNFEAGYKFLNFEKDFLKTSDNFHAFDLNGEYSFKDLKLSLFGGLEVNFNEDFKYFTAPYPFFTHSLGIKHNFFNDKLSFALWWQNSYINYRSSDLLFDQEESFLADSILKIIEKAEETLSISKFTLKLNYSF